MATLCGLSACGDGAHSREEWLDLSQVAPHTALVAGRVLARAQDIGGIA